MFWLFFFFTQNRLELPNSLTKKKPPEAVFKDLFLFIFQEFIELIRSCTE